MKPISSSFAAGRDKQRYVCLDVETTGLSARRGERIIELGAVIVDNGYPTMEFQSLINAGKQVTGAARKVHGISDEMLYGQPGPEEVYSRFRDFAGDGVLVAHHAAFDVGFLRAEYGRLGTGFPMRYFCTLELSRNLFPRLRDHKLETVYRHLFNEAPVRRHRALDDARMVARVWVEMVKISV